MKLFLVSYDVWDWDEHDSAVIAAESAVRAESIALESLSNSLSTKTTVEYIGESNGNKEGVVLESFNAG